MTQGVECKERQVGELKGVYLINKNVRLGYLHLCFYAKQPAHLLFMAEATHLDGPGSSMGTLLKE